MTVWVIGIFLGPKAHVDAHYMHRDACMQPPSLMRGTMVLSSMCLAYI